MCEPKLTLVPVRFLLRRSPYLARQIFESLSTVTVMLVGAGETIELVARHLREHSEKDGYRNRTRERAQVLADEVGAEVIALERDRRTPERGGYHHQFYRQPAADYR